MGAEAEPFQFSPGAACVPDWKIIFLMYSLWRLFCRLKDISPAHRHIFSTNYYAGQRWIKRFTKQQQILHTDFLTFRKKKKKKIKSFSPWWSFY